MKDQKHLNNVGTGLEGVVLEELNVDTSMNKLNNILDPAGTNWIVHTGQIAIFHMMSLSLVNIKIIVKIRTVHIHIF